LKKIFFLEKFIIELLVENGKPTGGASVQSLVWMKALKELNNEIYLANLEEDDRKIKKEFGWVNVVPLYHSKRFKKRLVWFTYRFPKIFLALKKIKPHYLYTSMPNWTSFYIGIICKILKIKHIIRTANDKNIDFSIDKRIKFSDRTFIKLSYRISDLILAQSNFQFETLKQQFSEKKLMKISNPIVIQKQYLIRRNSKQGYIAWVANFRYQKNLKLLYEIASSIGEEQFKIAGESLMDMDKETSTYYKKLKSLKNVEFMGSISQDKILNFLLDAKYLLSTSRFEGFSNTFLEAMMTGLPILSPLYINPDGIIDSFNLGILYNNPDDLTLKLNSEDLSSYIQKSGNCIQYLLDHHDHNKLANELLITLESL
jgi:glycosyltransferase involved in cell wall biosynthesis